MIWYNLQRLTNRKSHMVYRTAPFSMTLNDPYPRFQGHDILWRWISQKRYVIHSFNANSDLHTPYSTVSFWMTLNALEWLSKIFSDTIRARSVCDSWAYCVYTQFLTKKIRSASKRVLFRRFLHDSMSFSGTVSLFFSVHIQYNSMM